MIAWKHPEEEQIIANHRHQHAFILAGEEHVFGVHMTQYHCELHKYQIVIEVALPPEVHEELRRMRRVAPADTFVLCNRGEPEPLEQIYRAFSIPELASQRVRVFKGDIFQGLRPSAAEEETDPHFFPWDLDRVRPVFAEIDITVRRIVTFRPFEHHRALPPFATYLLFGRGAEAHMTNLQTAALATGPFEPPAFGPDFDHVLSLQEPVSWLDAPLLEAGIVVSVPKWPMLDPLTGKPNIPCELLFEPGEEFEVMYRGLTPVKRVTAGHTYLQCTAVCNGPAGSISTAKVMPCAAQDSCHISLMPRIYWVFPELR